MPLPRIRFFVKQVRLSVDSDSVLRYIDIKGSIYIIGRIDVKRKGSVGLVLGWKVSEVRVVY